jgi:hypothetical protein
MRCFFVLAATAALHPQAALGQTSAGAVKTVLSGDVQATPPASDAVIDSLLTVARKASDAFSDRNAAIAAGYRRVGMDFPSMGEHWVNARLLFEGIFDAARPAILTYTIVKGSPVLLGVVYAVPLSPGQKPPAAFGPNAIWHEHNGSLEEESLLPEHHSMPTVVSGTRVAVLHAWVRAANPDGVFAAENWTLPFIRQGLAVPAAFPKGAARALSLLSAGERYFREMAGDTASEAAGVALERCGAVTRNVVSRAQANGQVLHQADLEELNRAWTAAVLEVRQAAGPHVAKRINGGEL